MSVVALVKQTDMPCVLNGTCQPKMTTMINAAQVDYTSPWSFTDTDAANLLGSDGNDWSNYSDHHLGIDPSVAPNPMPQMVYPCGKAGKVYVSALEAAKGQATSRKEMDIAGAADAMLKACAAKKPKEADVSVKAALPTRAYSVLHVKTINDGERVIQGMASTPAVDRMQDTVQPLGAKFSVPMPLLWQHQASQPVGWVEFAKPDDTGIPFTARIATIDEPGEMQNLCNKAWQAVKAGLVRAVSIGFSVNKYETLKSGGWNITDWDWLELSLVTIPANAEATITNIKSADVEAMAKSGRLPLNVTKRTTPAGVTALSNPVVSSAQEAKHTMAKPINQQITEFEATRAAKAARMNEIMEVSAEKGETLDDAATEEYDTLVAEVRSVDQHLTRLRAHEKANLASATEVKTEVAADPAAGAGARAGVRVEVRGNNLPKGTPFTRYVIALARSKGNLMQAVEIAKQWHDSTPEVEMVLRTAVAAGTTTDTTWASPLVVYQNMASEFIEFLRPLTIVGRMQGMRRVPFNIKVPRQTTGATVNWVGENSVKPISSLAFDQLSLGFTKIAGIIPLSEELIRFSSPSAEQLVTQDLAASIAQFMDVEFIDPTVAAVTGVNPASITNAATPVTATGTTAAALRADIKTLMATFMSNSLNNYTSGVWIMTSQQALAISLMVNALGQPEFPGVTMQGGTFVGFPIIASENVPTVGSSPTDGSRIIFALADQIMLADDGQVTVDISREASLQMNTAPDSPATASTVMTSLWQNNLVGIKVERYVNWMLRHAAAVNYINYAKYAE